MNDIIVFSHLRWNFVFQRPQHVLSRVARGRRVFFVEEPVRCEGSEFLTQHTAEASGVRVVTPSTPVDQPGFHSSQIPALRRLMRSLIDDENLRAPVLWFYTPMALPLADEFQAKTIVYDCMDELTGFAGAPPELEHLEAELFKKAQVVFTGGRSLYEAKRTKNPNVHCLPSSVDVSHYARARAADLDHPEQAGLIRPRLGYFGVIDERMDLSILQALGTAHPEWQISMVGPVVKIDPASLPQLPNLHYFGQRPYEDLPRFLAGWDVCLLPFALNSATRFISPTKTLEYMAGEKAIVSTPIRDVADLYSDVVRIAADPADFVGACEQALAEPAASKQKRIERMREILQATSWDQTAARMEQLIEQCSAPKRKVTSIGPQPRDIVLGAGPTGLSAAYHLGEDALLLENNSSVGGWCRSIEVNGFTFDYAGHIMFSNDQYVHQLYQMLLGDNVHWQDREAWIFSKGVYTRYPFQGALYGLPPKVIKECIMGAIEARFGSVSKSSPQAKPVIEISDAKVQRKNGLNGSNGTGMCASDGSKDCCADGVLELNTPLVLAGQHGEAQKENAEDNFESFIYRTWGAGIARHFAIPYNRKLWAVPLSEMEISWLGGRVPLPDLEEMIEGALVPKPRPMGPNARFGYPLHGGFQALMDGFLPHLKGELRLNSKVVRVSPHDRRIYLDDGTEFRYRKLISTMPLPHLIKAIGFEAPSSVRRAAEALRFTSVVCVHIGVGRSNITDKHWIYYPEDTVFHRIFVQGNASPHCNPRGGFGFTCEITYGPSKPLPYEGEDLIQLCIRDAQRVGFIRSDDPIWATAICDLPCAYVVYDHQRAARVERIREWLASVDILLAGRYSEWEYYNSDHAFLAGKKAADQILQAESAPALSEQIVAG